MTIDERISSELRRHVPEVDENLAWERIQSTAPVRHRVLARSLPIAVAALGVVFLGFALVRTFPWDPAPVAALQSPFRGTWVTTDADESTPTMVVQVSTDGVIEIVVLDDLASVCSGAASTMTGTGRLEGDNVLVILAPVLTCDDGTELQPSSGTPLEELREPTFTHDSESDTLTDNLGSRWSREVAEIPTISEMWPQSSLEEVQEAQELADIGDPDYVWQVDPEIANGNSPEAEIVTRFIHEELGWEEFIFNPHVGWDAPDSNLNFIRCAPGGTNPVYPDDEYAGRCAPTIDELQYETVIIDLAQPIRSEGSGIWVVSEWRMGPPFSQRAPSTDEVTALMEDFLQARIDGEGAEQYVDVFDGELPLLNATSSGAPYERFEIERLRGPEWPYGETEFKARMFAGDTVVEQRFSTPGDGRLGIEYFARGNAAASTTENGQPLPVPYDIFDDGVITLHAPWPWRLPWGSDWGLLIDHDTTFDHIQLLRDPVPVGTGCNAAGPALADAQALAESIRSDPDLVATAPVAVSLGGAEALWMDVETARAGGCDYAMVENFADEDRAWIHLAPGNRLRLYLLDLPEGLPTRVLAMAVIAPEERFEAVLETAEPILESIEFHTD